jgi:hypothetical protein
VSFTTPSNTARFITVNSYSPSSTPTAVKVGSKAATAGCTNCMGVQRLSLIWSRLKNTVLSHMRSMYIGDASFHTLTYFREEIGVLTSLPLLKNIVDDLEMARNHGKSSLTLYFTKESHIHTLMNLILAALPVVNRRVPELDYCVRLIPSSMMLLVH